MKTKERNKKVVNQNFDWLLKKAGLGVQDIKESNVRRIISNAGKFKFEVLDNEYAVIKIKGYDDIPLKENNYKLLISRQNGSFESESLFIKPRIKH